MDRCFAARPQSAMGALSCHGRFLAFAMFPVREQPRAVERDCSPGPNVVHEVDVYCLDAAFIIHDLIGCNRGRVERLPARSSGKIRRTVQGTRRARARRFLG